jgi:hypothetical protein
MAQIGIVIVHCGGEAILEQCIRTLEEQTLQGFRVVVVDNGSEDGSVERVVGRHPDVAVIRLEKNLGWSGGNNQGIRALLDAGAEWIWLLNNDTLVDSDCLNRMMEYTKSHPAMKVLSPIVKYADPPGKVWFQGGKVDVRRVEVTVCESPEEFHALGGEVWPYISGCAMLVHRDVFLKIGLIDERYYLYCEDVDFSVRAWRAGFGLAVVPDAELRHLVSYSTGGVNAKNPFRLYHFLLSTMQFWRKLLGMREFHRRACPVYFSKRLCGEASKRLSELEWDAYADVLWALFTRHRGGGRRANSPRWFRRLLERKPWVVIAVLSWDLRPFFQSMRKQMKAKDGF